MNILRACSLCLASLTALAAQAETPVNPVPAFLAEKQKFEDAVTAKVEAISATITAHESAQRLKPEEVQRERERLNEVRRSLQSKGVFTSSSKRTSSVPNEAFEALNEAWEDCTLALQNRNDFLATAEPKLMEDTQKYAASIWRAANDDADLVPAIEAARFAERQTSAKRGPGADLFSGSRLSSFLQASQRFLEALALGNTAVTSNAWQQMANPGYAGRGASVIPLAEIEQWRGRFELRFGQELAAQNAAANEAIVRDAGSAELTALADKIDGINAKLRALANTNSFAFGERGRAEENVARKVAPFLEAAEQGNIAAVEKAAAAWSQPTGALSPAARAALQKKLAAIQQKKIAAEAESRKALESRIRERLTKISDAASANALAEELRSEITQASGRPESSMLGALEGDLRQLALSWSDENTAVAGRDFSRQSAGAHPWAAELKILRQKAFRAALVRQLKAPELLSAPLDSLAPEAALRQLARDLFAREEWPRLHDLLVASEGLREDRSFAGSDDLRAVKSLLTAQNFERAEQFGDAVQSYRAVLICIGELVPIDAAAARLKALKKEHPDAFPKPSQLPGPSPLGQFP